MGVYRTDVVVQLSCRHKRSEKGNNKREGEGEKKREKERTSFMPAITVYTSLPPKSQYYAPIIRLPWGHLIITPLNHLTFGLAECGELSLVAGVEPLAGQRLQVGAVLAGGSPRSATAGAEERVVAHAPVLQVRVV